MPWIAELGGDRVIPEGVPDKTDVECPECGSRMRPRGPMSDGRARHFFHVGNGKGGAGNGGGGASCESVGESDIHRKWKSLAVSRLRELYESEAEFIAPEYRLGAEVDLPSGADFRDADALVAFEEPKPPLGNGIVIEVQYRNESKDIEAVQEDYLALGYSVYWANEDDFQTDRALFGVTALVEGTIPVWPTIVPPQRDWSGMEYDLSSLLNPPKPPNSENPTSMELRSTTIRGTRSEWMIERAKDTWSFPSFNLFNRPVTLPPEFVEDQIAELWRYTDWDSRFPDSDVGEYISEVQSAVLVGTTPRGSPPFAKWIQEGDSDLRPRIIAAYRAGREYIDPGSHSDREQAFDAVVRITKNNTGGVQSDSASHSAIKQIACRAGHDPKVVEHALEAAVDSNYLTRTSEGRYKLGPQGEEVSYQ